MHVRSLAAGANDERDSAVQDQEHPDGERAVPRAETCGDGRRPPHRQGPQPHKLQRLGPLVISSMGARTRCLRNNCRQGRG
jgi:hypothetical protein